MQNEILLPSQQLNLLRKIQKDFSKTSFPEEKIQQLLKLPFISEKAAWFSPSWKEPLSDTQKILFLIFLNFIEALPDVLLKEEEKDSFLGFIGKLEEIERFYEPIGGLVGYQIKVLEKLVHEKEEPGQDEKWEFPFGFDLTKDDGVFLKAGIQALPLVAEMYPVGGAGDRLDLMDEKTKRALPAASLPFLGRTLIEGLIRDLQGKEYLYYKLFGKQLLTPIALMTSSEKHNDEEIRDIFKKANWFLRPKELFYFFMQPQAPLVTVEGHWVIKLGWKIAAKPGGHGVIWTLAKQLGVFKWLKKLKRPKGIIRQINNPLAGVDCGLLKLLGIGVMREKAFGFLSCDRLVGSAEGMNVLIEKKVGERNYAGITNIEYTDFVKKGIIDEPEKEGSLFSRYPSNTNILFADWSQIEEGIKKLPLPGLTLNMKTKASLLIPEGGKNEVTAGRLEAAMQNLADAFFDPVQGQMDEKQSQSLSTFLAYNPRKKTISTTKKKFVPGSPLNETPEGCFLDILLTARELLEKDCRVEVPEFDAENAQNPPPFIFLYHPALGPLYKIIGQKIRGGKLHKGAEVQLEIAELEWVNSEVEGSLKIVASSVMGDVAKEGFLRYSERVGKCVFSHVRVKNKGIDYKEKNLFWKNEIKRIECCTINLHGNAELIAKDVTLSGDLCFEVPDGMRFTLLMENDRLVVKKEAINHALPSWRYNLTAQDVELSKSNGETK